MSRIKNDEVSSEDRAYLKSVGKWEIFEDLVFEAERDSGDREHSINLALAELMPKGNATGGTTLVNDLLMKVPSPPKDVLGRKASETENIRWINDNLVVGSDLSDCPSPSAWLELHLCRIDKDCMLNFLKGPRMKIVSSKGEAVKKKSQDGKVTLDVIKELKKFVGKEEPQIELCNLCNKGEDCDCD